MHFNHLYDPISLVRDDDTRRTLSAAGLTVSTHTGDALYEPWDVLDAEGRPFSAFEPFWERLRALAATSPPGTPLPPPAELPPPPTPPPSLALADVALLSPAEDASNAQLARRWTPGEAGAAAALATFLGDGLPLFDADRAKADRASTSRLSPHLHWGEASPRAVVAAVASIGDALAAAGADPAPAAAFVRHAALREYGRHLCFHHPFTHERSLLDHLRSVPWSLDQRAFKAWRQGRTGYPLVDAGMRELWATGWLHNRARVVCASFLVKHLVLPWQWGLKHFWDALVDADLECCALGWQYVAGGLPDGHAFSVAAVDPVAEGRRYDPSGSYVRTWVPALARLPDAWIHAPWTAPASALDDAGVELGRDGTYPLPIVSPEDAAHRLAAAAAAVAGGDGGSVGVPPAPCTGGGTSAGATGGTAGGGGTGTHHAAAAAARGAGTASSPGGMAATSTGHHAAAASSPLAAPARPLSAAVADAAFGGAVPSLVAPALGGAATEGVSSNCVGTTAAGGVCGPATTTMTTDETHGGRVKRRRDGESEVF